MKKHFTFGKIINIEISGGVFQGKYVSVIKEYDDTNNILYISQPRISNLFVPLSTGEPLIIHYLEGSMSCNFKSIILDIINFEDFCVYKIEGPDKIQKSDRRKHLRMPVYPPAQINYFSQYSPTIFLQGILTDISFSGINIETQKKTDISDPLSLSFKLPKHNGGTYGIEELAVKVIWNKKINNREFSGCAIQNFKGKQETFITDYIINLQRANNWETHVKKIVGSLIE
ncbi:flagellar brake protein [Candidatus Dependentiae bacterium]|nr:flagellar brake protein [Candidatus Dependentiae bacterium]